MGRLVEGREAGVEAGVEEREGGGEGRVSERVNTPARDNKIRHGTSGERGRAVD